MRSTIFHLELALPTPPDRDAIGDRSWLLRAAAAFPDRLVLAFGAPGTTKDESLGRLFPNLKPIGGDTYEVELAAILHERLPGPENGLEYVVVVADTAAIEQMFCLSNTMNLIRYRRGDTDRHVICHASATKRVVDEKKEEFGSTPHVEFIPSVVTARYLLKGSDAEDALAE